MSRSFLLAFALAEFATASAQAANTYTNNFGTSGAPLTVSDFGVTGAWDTSGAYPSYKPWDVTVGANSVTIRGQATLPQSYINANPAAAGAGAASFMAQTTFSGISSFKVSDLISLSFTARAGNLNTTAPYGNLFLYTADNKFYFVHMGNSSVDLTFPGDGNYISTYTNFQADPNGRTYVGLGFAPALSLSYPGPTFVKGQFSDVQLFTISMTATAGGTPVPEPSTYGFALGGLALVGAVIRRRKISK